MLNTIHVVSVNFSHTRDVLHKGSQGKRTTDTTDQTLAVLQPFTF